MIKQIFLYILLAALFACNDNKIASEQVPEADTKVIKPPSEVAPQLFELPSFVIYKNWEIGDLKNMKMISNVYKAWDGGKPGEMERYFADSTAFDFPDGQRQTTTNKTVESKFRKWRSAYKETSNIPFSLISLYNKDRDQEWVIAWTWNKWRYTDGMKDSMLYCDNWRIKDGRIVYLNSLEHRPSKTLSRALNKIAPN